MPFIFSLWVHIVLLFALPLTTEKTKSLGKGSQKKSLHRRVIEVRRIHSKRGNVETKPSQLPEMSLGDLGMSRDGVLKAYSNEKQAQDEGASLSNRSEGAYGIKNALDFKRDSELSSQIERYLDYPPIFGSLNIQGEVIAKLAFNSDGMWVEQKSKYSSSSKYLQVLVVRALRKSLVGKKFKGIKNFILTRFKFRLSTSLIGSNEFMAWGDGLTFYRSTYGGEEGIQKATKFATRLARIFTGDWIGLAADLKGPPKQDLKKLKSYQQDPAWDY